MAACKNYKALNDNFTPDEHSTLKDLVAREDIIMTPADKGSGLQTGVTVLEKADYLQKARHQLGNGSHYRILDIDVNPLDCRCHVHCKGS